MKKIHLLMSLNNPNIKYFDTRHNIGSLWIRYFCLKNNINLSYIKSLNSNFTQIDYNDNKLYILEPCDYINLSGEILYNFYSIYKIQLDSILIIHDDIALSKGVIKFKFAGQSSHNGIINIVDKFFTKNFFRIRIGIGNNFDLKSYVLEKLTTKEKRITLNSIKFSMNFIDDILNLNLNYFRNNIYNRSFDV
jgi:peptidyl-tRNA hydrolase, PTH1 family